MRSINRKMHGIFALLALLGLAVSGCGTSESSPSGDGSDAPTIAVNDGGWWCPEHGVPEAGCARCDSSLVADFKAKGDWCEKHDRPESQCFICRPELEAKLAARYEAKFGKKPPKPEPEG